MVSRSLSVLVALIPAVAFANAVADENPEIPQAELETWSDEQLCRARDIPEALDELERREVFDRRDLRAIRRDEVRKGISEDALRCLKGSPEFVHSAIATFEGETVDAFVYPPGTLDSLIVYLRRVGDVSTVAAFTESAEPYRFQGWSAGPDCCYATRIFSGASSYARGNDRRSTSLGWSGTTAASLNSQRIYVVSDPSPSVYYPQAP